MNEPTAKFITITPNMAKNWLDKNTNNRPVNEANLLQIAHEMNRKNFHLTGESIKIAQDGTLLDGQHRLLAIVKTSLSVKMLVVEGLENNAFKYIDTGRKRQASDVLAIEKYQNPGKISGMIKFIINFKNGQYYNTAGGKNNKGSKAITNATISEFMEKNKESVVDSFPYGFTSKNKIASGTIVSGLHYICKSFDDVKADEFFHKLITGEELAASSPINLLRQKLIQDMGASRKMKPLEKLALICKAWNLYRSGKKVTLLTWQSIKEPFPKPI